MEPAEKNLGNLAQKTRILLVDEHPITAEIERTYLISVGFEVALASDIEDALAKIKSASFDLVMIDVNFRGDKGVETLKALKKQSQNSALKSIVSGLAFPPPLKKKVREAGADEIFIKPVPRQQVLKDIKRLTEGIVRGTERIAHSLRLVLRWGQDIQSCHTLDVSSEGLHLTTEQKAGGIKPKIGTQVEMDIQLTDKEALSRVLGEVVRHTSDGFGVRFQKLKKADQKKLDKYILKHSLEHAASHFYL